ncbi:MAG: outer membrane protein assembly factor BamB family protein [Planctomycetota bacterium]
MERTRLAEKVWALSTALCFAAASASRFADAEDPGIGLEADWPSFRGSPGMEGRRGGKVSDRPRRLWTFEARSEIESTAAIAEGRVFVGVEDGLIALALEPGEKDGRLLWRFRSDAGVRASPLAAEGRVYFGDDGGTFHALEASSGKEAWKFATESGSEILSSANFAEGRVAFGSYDATLYCLDAASGKPVWALETGGPVHSGPAIAEGRVFVAGCDGRLRVVSLAEGKEVSALALGSQSAASPCVFGERLFVGTLAGEILCADWREAKELWRYADPERRFPFHSSAALAPLGGGDAAIVVGGRDKLVRAVRARDGKALWTFPAGAEVDASPAIVGERVFVATKAGNLHLLEVSTGKEVWKFEAGSGFAASPALARGRLVISTEDGQVLCFDIRPEAGGKDGGGGAPAGGRGRPERP